VAALQLSLDAFEMHELFKRDVANEKKHASEMELPVWSISEVFRLHIPKRRLCRFGNEGSANLVGVLGKKIHRIDSLLCSGEPICSATRGRNDSCQSFKQQMICGQA